MSVRSRHECRSWCQTRGGNQPLIDLEAEYAVAPVPVTKPSWDLLRGPGRVINRMQSLKKHPTVEFIAKARDKHVDAVIEIDGVWVMQAWKTRLSEWRVNPTDAAN